MLTSIWQWLLPCMFTWLSAASAETGNYTVSFATSDTSCDVDSVPAGTIALTTSSIPQAYTCFNLSDLFSQGDDNGLKLGSGASQVPSAVSGVNWTLLNHNLYNPHANYSRIWLQQVNLTKNEMGDGKASARSLEIFTLPNCQMSRNDDPVASTPWWWETCQTKTNGDCHVVPYSVQSFSIFASAKNPYPPPKCVNWAYMDAATRPSLQSIWAAIVSCVVLVLAVVI